MTQNLPPVTRRELRAQETANRGLGIKQNRGTKQNIEPGQNQESRNLNQKPRSRRRILVLGVIGELLITFSVITLLYICWMLFWNGLIFGTQQQRAAANQTRDWINQSVKLPKSLSLANKDDNKNVAEVQPFVDPDQPQNTTIFAVMYVPRFGIDSQRNIAQGYGRDVLNSYQSGVGHYPATSMPGAVGNFAIAAHRWSYGEGMHEIAELRQGDAIYISTKYGWYTYRFRNFEWVLPSAVDVLDPVPRQPGQSPGDRIITLTSCSPFYTAAERIIAYGVLESWRVGANNPPPEIAEIVQNWGK